MISIIARVFPALARLRWFALACLWPLSTMAATIEVTLAYQGDPSAAAYRGAQQGLEEANAQGEFLGQHYRLVIARNAAGAKNASAIIAELDDAKLIALANSAPEVAVLNVSNDHDHLRALCRTNLLHVLPHTKMLNDAVAQWQKLHPDAKAVTAHAWNADFDKYAALQLNKRYTEKFKSKMDDQAWAGWAAVKLISDTIAREQTSDGAKLLSALRGKLAFDGQKGTEMSFRDNGQLRQPLLIVSNGRVIGEAPVRGVVEAENLDSLGALPCTSR